MTDRARFLLRGLVWGCVMALSAAETGRADDAESRRKILLFEYEGPAKRLAIQHAAVRFNAQVRSVSAKVTQTTIVRGKFHFDHHILFGENVMTDNSTGGVLNKSSGSVSGRNSKYGFSIHENPGKGHVLDDVRVFTHESMSKEPYCVYAFAYSDAWSRTTYLALFEDPESEVVLDRQAVWHRRDVREVQIDRNVKRMQEKEPRRIRTAYYFAPADGWVCVGNREVPIPPDNEPTYREEVHHYSIAAGLARPVRSEIWLRDERSPDADTRVREIVFDEYEPLESFDVGECRLSAFGLPEPVGVDWTVRRSIPIFVWYLLGAVGFLFVAVFLRRAALRRAAR